MAGPTKRYKIQIIKAGIGDPVIAVCFKFVDEDGFDNPVTDPVDRFMLYIYLTYQSVEGQPVIKNAGYAEFARLGTLNYYYMSMPFDQPADINLDHPIEMSWDAVGPNLEFVVEDNNSILEDNGQPLNWGDLQTRYTYCPGAPCTSLGLA